MNNNIKIFYNDLDLFSGISPTPFISFNQNFIDYKTEWNQTSTITMNGQLTGDYLGQLSFYEINNRFNLLLNRLSNNFGTLVIKEDTEVLFSGQSVVVESIESEENNWYGVFPFSINFTIYETGLFSNYFGIIDPKEEISISESEGSIVNLKHSISAKGLNINNISPIRNAKNWVRNRSGNYNKVFSIIAPTGGSNFILDSVSESVDRFNSVYSLELDYIKSSSPESPSGTLLNYTLDFLSGVELGFINANIQGRFSKNNISGLDSNLRSGFLNYDFYNLVNQACIKTFGVILNSTPISQSIEEDYSNNNLNFNILYSNDFTSNVVNDYTVEMNTDSIKNITTVNLSASIFAKYGDVSSRWNQVQNFYQTSFNPFSLVNKVYKTEHSKQLYSTPRTESITFDEYNGKINYQGSWSDKRRPFSEDVLTMESNIQLNAPVKIHIADTSAFVPRAHNIQNLVCANRSILNLNVSARAKPNKPISVAEKAVNQELNRIRKNYNLTSSLLQDRSVKKNSDLKTISINEIWSSEGPIIT
jgi:hypothetical protein